MISDDDDTGRPIWHVPMTTDEFKPQKAVELAVRFKAFVRDYWPMIQPFAASMGGEGPPEVTKNPKGEEWAMVLKIKEVAANNGYQDLGQLDPDEFRLRTRRAMKALTDIPVAALIKQGARLRLEDKRGPDEAPAE